MHKILAVIPARGGSKGMPRKNIREIGGKPLLAWTIEEAKKSKYIERIILSSEDDEIINIAKEYGCDVPFVRPKELATDDATSVDSILHAINECKGYDYVVLLQPTSPLRTVEDIDGCIELVLKEKTDFSVTVTVPENSPYWMYTLENGNLKALIQQDNFATRRQDLPKAYALNGAVYVANVKALCEQKTFLTETTKAYIMPHSRSFDIDTEIDFKICEYLLSN
ncbi:acylneuraminate cytidylyltransferase family protein [Lysinibacillus capsici]|uniref:acylneuraminate cytidylyltransferase family protein n=1 Tax=Lysinibacillus capsici TaxID=2115968 RepID=UPI002E1ECB36|nr:acylneuraminate cytidylyltransferase family protein [Lysinibacillus capsici]